MEQIPQIQIDSGARRIGSEELQLAEYIDRAVAYILDIILFTVTLIIGWFIWSFILWSNRSGQTPGKQIIGIMVVTQQGYPPSLSGMFIREMLIKGLGIPILSSFTGPILAVIDLLWPLWDRDRQTLHDKMIVTFVVKASDNRVL